MREEETLYKTVDLMIRKEDELLAQFTEPMLLALHQGVSIYTAYNNLNVSSEATSISSQPVLAFLRDCLRATETTQGDVCASVKLIVLSNNGYISRSDFLELRLNGCEHLRKVVGFIPPLQAVNSCQSDDLSSPWYRPSSEARSLD